MKAVVADNALAVFLSTISGCASLGAVLLAETLLKAESPAGLMLAGVAASLGFAWTFSRVRADALRQR